MKKMFAILLIVAVAVSALTLNVSAVGIEQNETQKRNEIIEKACQVFPEYASIIRNEDSSALFSRKSYTDAKPVVVCEKTRPVGPNRNITYTELSDGAVVLASYEFNATDETTHEPTHGGNTKYTATVDVMCTASDGIFTLRNIRYTISDGYDKITNSGSPSVNYKNECIFSTSSVHDYDVNPNETLHSAAYIKYKLSYHVRGLDAGFYYRTIFTFSIRNNSVTISTPVVE